MLMFANAQCELTIRNYSVISIDKFVRVVTNWCETQIFYEDICFFESLSKLLLCGYLLDVLECFFDLFVHFMKNIM